MRADEFIPVIIGPTASGKSALALHWAEHNGAEIVSADSRQVFRHMSIGTAKPSPWELARVPHHFVDERDPDEPMSAAQFAGEADRRIEALRSSGTAVIVAGGSTMYVQALLHGLSPVPEVPAEVRDSVAHTLAQQGLGALVAEFQRVDPELAARTDLANPRRVQRAVEVYRHTGRPLSSFHGQTRPAAFRYSVLYLAPERDALYRQIERRVDDMVVAGLLDEVADLLDRGYAPTLQALQTIGYAEMVRHLEGLCSLETAVADIKTNTRRYAKRQMTYFNKYFPEAVKVDPARTALDDAAISRMLAPR